MLADWQVPELEPFRDHVELIAHRVVHKGEQFTAHTLIEPNAEATLQKPIPLAPMHNPPALHGLA